MDNNLEKFAKDVDWLEHQNLELQDEVDMLLDSTDRLADNISRLINDNLELYQNLCRANKAFNIRYQEESKELVSKCSAMSELIMAYERAAHGLRDKDIDRFRSVEIQTLRKQGGFI